MARNNGEHGTIANSIAVTVHVYLTAFYLCSGTLHVWMLDFSNGRSDCGVLNA